MPSTQDSAGPTALPVHPVPTLPAAEEWQLTLQNGGRSVTLNLAAVARLPHVELLDTFTCLAGWTAGPLHWRGVPLQTLLDAAGGTMQGWIAFDAPDLRSVVPLAELPEDTLVADTLDGAPLPREHGGPYRLVVPGGICYRAVKWVQRIALQDSGEGDTAPALAGARLKTKDA